MFLDFELFYSRPRFNNADSNSPTPELITSIDHDTSPGAVQPVLPSSTMTTGHLTAMSRCRWWHHRSTSFSSSSTNLFHHHSTRFPRRARSNFLMTSLDTFSSSSTNWFPDIIRHHSTRFPRRARNWFPDYIIRHHSTRFPRQARTSKQMSTSLFKGLVDPRSSSFACDVHLLPGPGPALTSAAISDKFVVAFLSYNFWTSPSQSSNVSWMWFTSIANYHYYVDLTLFK